MLDRIILLAIILLVSFSIRCQDKGFSPIAVEHDESTEGQSSIEVVIENKEVAIDQKMKINDKKEVSWNKTEVVLERTDHVFERKNLFINRTELITFAKQYLGTTYISGSVDPEQGFDCSGFVYFVFKAFQVAVPRSSRDYKSFGKALKPEEFKVGDILVFYGYVDSSSIGHVGIICEAKGMESRFIHSSSGKPYGVTISNLDSKSYSNRFYKCINVID